MDWRIILVIVISAIVVLGFVIFGAVYAKLKSRFLEAIAQNEIWEQKLKAEQLNVDRLKDMIEAKEMSHVEAFEKLSDGLANLDLFLPGGSPSR